MYGLVPIHAYLGINIMYMSNISLWFLNSSNHDHDVSSKSM